MFFLPFRIDRALKRFPAVTVTLIVVNALICFATFWNVPVIQALGFKMNAAGAYTWLTSLFLHGDPIFHLGGNMYFLWLFGSVVEDAVGRLRYIGLYIAGGLAASLVHGAMVLTFLPQMRDVPTVGASGAIAAVIGVFAVRLYHDKMRVFWFAFYRWGTFDLTSVAGVILWGLREVASGVVTIAGATSSVANWAHVGGLAFGVVAALAFGLATESDREHVRAEADEYTAAGLGNLAVDRYQKLAATDPSDPDLALQAARAAAQDPQARATAAREFRRAIGLLARTSRADDLVDAYRSLCTIARPSGLEGRTLQQIGSAAESLRRFDAAGGAYWELVKEHPATREAERAHFRLAHVYLETGMDAEARQTWESFASAHPNSQWFPYADARLLAAG